MQVPLGLSRRSWIVGTLVLPMVGMGAVVGHSLLLSRAWRVLYPLNAAKRWARQGRMRVMPA
jgi:hypothetical protein